VVTRNIPSSVNRQPRGSVGFGAWESSGAIRVRIARPDIVENPRKPGVGLAGLSGKPRPVP
jgi:hypothetical protein